MMPMDAAAVAPAGLNPPTLRCTVRLPMDPQGWDSVLARCDGRPVAIGLPGGGAHVPGTNAAQYASDMQVIAQALSQPAPAFPTWLAVACALLGAGALYASVKAVARRLPRGEHPSLPGRLARFTRRYSTISHPR